jgi:hypothetical protein
MTAVSDDLRMIADWIAACSLHQKPIMPPASAQLAKVLLHLSGRAEAQEHMPIVLTTMCGDLYAD